MCVTMGIPLAWPLTAVEVSLFSLASCCPCACYIYTFTLQTGVTRYNLWKSVLKLCSTFVHCQTSFTCLLPATSPLWNWAVRRGLEFIKLSGAGRLQEAQIGLPFSVLSTDLWYGNVIIYFHVMTKTFQLSTLSITMHWCQHVAMENRISAACSQQPAHFFTPCTSVHNAIVFIWLALFPMTRIFSCNAMKPLLTFF